MTVPPPTNPSNPSNRRRVPAQRQRSTATLDVGGLPLITVRLDAEGELEPGGEAMLLGELAASGVSDLLMFCHGWNAGPWGISRSPSQGFFHAVPSLLERFGAPGRRVALVDVHWPGQRWSDEPVPALDRVGVFGLTDSFDRLAVPAPQPPDEASQWTTRSAFGPAQRERVDELLELLATRPDDSAALKRARVLIRTLAEEAPDPGDGERRDVLSIVEIDDPYPDQLFADFALRLTDLGIVTDPAGGSAGFGDSTCRLWHGAQEVVRQITYWQLKRRAAVVGERGLGPLVNRLHEQHPDLGINVIGHGLGARAVGYALRGLPPTPVVRSVTFLQAAVSHFAFADKLPFDQSRSGALAGVQDRVAGPVVACYSRHDTALGVFYRLAARAAGPDSVGFETVGQRWSALGQDGHQPAAREFPLNPIGVAYDFERSGLVNIDASWVVGHGPPPSGAHSDICHPELAWVPLSAGGLC
jgi:broad specificity phosphatase PhoE